MAFTPEELVRYQKMVEAYIEKRRPPEHLRHQIDLSFRIQNQSIEIFEIRPGFMDPLKKIENSIAKTTWVSSRQVWRIFWQRADLKWHSYGPLPEVKTLKQFIDEVDADPSGCFFG